MAWFNRPEGFVTKSTDIYAPPIEVAKGIKFAARIGTFTPMTDQTFTRIIEATQPCCTPADLEAGHTVECPAYQAWLARQSDANPFDIYPDY